MHKPASPSWMYKPTTDPSDTGGLFECFKKMWRAPGTPTPRKELIQQHPLISLWKNKGLTKKQRKKLDEEFKLMDSTSHEGCLWSEVAKPKVSDNWCTIGVCK